MSAQAVVPNTRNNNKKQNLFAFSIALLSAPLFIPCEFDFRDFDPGSLDPSQLTQGTVIPWGGPESKPVVTEYESMKLLQVYTDKTSMPEQYRTSCIHTNGHGAVSLAHEKNDIEGHVIDPAGSFIPVPLTYLDEVIQIIDNYKGDKKGANNDSIMHEGDKSLETENENGSNEMADNGFSEADDGESLEPVSLDSLEVTDIVGTKDGFIIR